MSKWFDGELNPEQRTCVLRLRSRILDNVPSTPDLEIKDAVSNLAGAASDTTRETDADPIKTDADPIKSTAGRVTDKTTTNFNLLKDEAMSQ